LSFFHGGGQICDPFEQEILHCKKYSQKWWLTADVVLKAFDGFALEEGILKLDAWKSRIMTV
jgi:hypothetical protein